jgi:bifunctional non-homologous end joining protein LigD
MVQDLPSLVWVANLASLELHTSLSKAEKLDQPTALAFDLDPGPPANIVQCCQVALWLREIFEQHELLAFPKTSGSKGMQVYVPLNTPVDYEDTKKASHSLAIRLEEEHPEAVVSLMEKARRGGKVFIDWSQNDEHKTTVNVYSLRARERPTVSTPLTWDEVEECCQKKDASVLVFETDDVLERVEKKGDLFEPVITLKQHIPNALLQGSMPSSDPTARRAAWAKRREAEREAKEQ